MGRQQSRQRQIGEDVAVVDEESLILHEEIFDVFDPPGGVEENLFMAEEDRPSPPAPLGKLPVIGRRTVVGVDDEPLDADRQAMVHREGDQRSPADRKEGFGGLQGQGPQARAHPRPEDEGRPDSHCTHFHVIPPGAYGQLPPSKISSRRGLHRGTDLFSTLRILAPLPENGDSALQYRFTSPVPRK